MDLISVKISLGLAILTRVPSERTPLAAKIVSSMYSNLGKPVSGSVDGVVTVTVSNQGIQSFDIEKKILKKKNKYILESSIPIAQAKAKLAYEKLMLQKIDEAIDRLIGLLDSEFKLPENISQSKDPMEIEGFMRNIEGLMKKNGPEESGSIH